MQPAPREKEKIRVVLPSPVRRAPAGGSSPRLRPAAPAVETAVAPDERRDANDLARAAIERLRANDDTARARRPRRPARPKRPVAMRPVTMRLAIAGCPAGRDRACASSAAAADHGLGRAGRRTVDSTTGSLAGAAALCRRRTERRYPPSDAAGRHSALAPARSACRNGRAFGARTRHGAAEDALSTAEVDLSTRCCRNVNPAFRCGVCRIA